MTLVVGKVDGLMDYLLFYVLNSSSVTSGHWMGDNERLCTIEPDLRLKRSRSEPVSDPVHLSRKNFRLRVITVIFLPVRSWMLFLYCCCWLALAACKFSLSFHHSFCGIEQRKITLHSAEFL